MKKSVNRIAFFNILSILLLQGISFISSPLFSRLLGTGGYGNLSSFTIWANILSTVLFLQTNITIVNARVEFPQEEQAQYQSSIMALSLLVFLVGGTIGALLIRPLSALLQMEKVVLALLLFQALGSFGVNFLNSKFTYEFQAERNMLLSVGMAVSTFGLSLILVLNMPNRFFGRIVGNAVAYGVVGVVACIGILWKGRTFYNPRYWKFCLVLAIPMVFQALSYQILGSSDILMLKQMVGESDSGIYSLAFLFCGILFTIFQALDNTWRPFFFEDMKEGRIELVRQQAERYLELFTVLTVGFLLLVREVYHIYAGADFWSGIELMPLFLTNYYLNFLCTFPVNYEYFQKKTMVVSAAMVVSSLINLVLNYIFIRLYGMAGAAVATVLSHGIQLGMHEIYCCLTPARREYPFPMLGWLKYAAGFAAAVVLFYLLPGQWYLRWALGAVLGCVELWRIWKRKSLL